MELSLYLARGWGIFIFLTCLGLFANKKCFTDMLKNMQNDLCIVIAGAFAIFIGAFQIAAYNNWSLDWRGLVTILGWTSLVKGAAIIFVPGYIEKFAKVAAKESWYTASFAAGAIIGLYLLYVGYLVY